MKEQAMEKGTIWYNYKPNQLYYKMTIKNIEPIVYYQNTFEDKAKLSELRRQEGNEMKSKGYVDKALQLYVKAASYSYGIDKKYKP